MKFGFLLLLVASSIDIRFRDGREGPTERSREGERPVNSAAAPYLGPYFEFAPPDGGLGTTPCISTNPTGATGQTLSMVRSGVASCLKSDSLTSGILPGDMVWVPTNTARLMYADTTTHQLGIMAEQLGVNYSLRGTELDNASWVAVAVVTANTTPGLDGGLNAETLTDSSALVIQGVTQVISTTTLSKYSFSCFVGGSTATTATISITGVGNSAGDCSNTATGIAANSYTRISCTSTAAYASGLTAVGVFIGVGNDVSVTGDLIATGCQLDKDSRGFPTSYMQTQGASAVRNADQLSYALPAPYASPTSTVAAGCTRACVRPGYWTAGSTTIPAGYGVYTGANGRGIYRGTAGTAQLWSDGANADTAYPTNPTFSAASSVCWVSTFAGAASVLKISGGASAGHNYDGDWGIGVNNVRIGWSDTGGAATSQYDGIISQVRFDPQDAGACE